MLALTYPPDRLQRRIPGDGGSAQRDAAQRLVNPWLAALVAFVPIILVLTGIVFAIPLPLPQPGAFAKVHWYDGFGEVAGSAAVLAGLLLVDEVGSGPLNGLTVTGAILISLVLDWSGWLGLPALGFQLLPWIGGTVMIAGVVAITLGVPDRDDYDGGAGGLTGKFLHRFILVCGGLQAVGAALNAGLRHAVTNPWLAADLPFIPVASLFALLFVMRPLPLPNREQLGEIRWWMPMAGLVGALAVFTGLLFIDKVGAGLFNGLLITANLVAAIVLDHFGWLGMKRTPTTKLRLLGAVVTIAGILMIALYKALNKRCFLAPLTIEQLAEIGRSLR